MLKRNQRKALLIICSTAAILILGLAVSTRLPELQMKTNQGLTWIRGVFQPHGSLPTAETAYEQSKGQTTFWLPDVMAITSEASPLSANTPIKRSVVALPSSMLLKAPEFNPHRDYQDWNNCGPATLALGLRYWGWQGDQFTISEVIRPKRQDKNVNIEELAAYVNQNTQGYQAEMRVGGDLITLENFIAGGFPVIIEEAFKVEKPAWPGDDLWAGHYLLLTAYNEQTRLFTAQDSYYGPDQQLPFDTVAEAWEAFNHTYLVIFTLGDLQKVQTLFGENWQADHNVDQALSNINLQLQSESGNAFAWFNLGTNLVTRQDYASAVKAFDQARTLGLPQRMLRYQFGPLMADYQTGDEKDLMQLADYALNITPDSEEALLWKGWAFELAGDHLSAIDHFNQALEVHPGYLEAENALSAVRP